MRHCLGIPGADLAFRAGAFIGGGHSAEAEEQAKGEQQSEFHVLGFII